MITVRAHRLTRPVVADGIADDVEFIEGNLLAYAGTHPEYVGKQSAFMLGRVVEAYAAGDLATTHRFMQVTADLAAGAFQIWRQEGPVEFTIEGRPFRSADLAPSYGSGPSDWVQQLCLAVALRRDDTVEVLLDYPEAQLKKFPGQFDEAWYPLVDALKAFWSRRAYKKRLADFLKASEVEHLTVMSPELAERYRAVVPALAAIERGDQETFTGALVAGLKAHKAVMGHEDNAKDVTGLLALPVIGIAALGVRRGLALEVSSSYCPAWLVNQGAPPPSRPK